MPRSFAGGMRGRPVANLFNVPRLPGKELKENTDAMGIDDIDELQAWVDGLLKEDREEENSESPSLPMTSSNVATDAQQGEENSESPSLPMTSSNVATDAQQGASASAQGAVPSLPSPAILETAWGAARATQPIDGIQPPCSLSGPGASVVDGKVTSTGTGGHHAALRLSAADLKILDVPMGSYFAYPGRALEGYTMFAIVPPAQHAHLNHQLQVLLRMEHILRISGLGDDHSRPVGHRVLHHVIVPSRHLGQPPEAIAMESLLTLVKATDEPQGASTILCQSRPYAE